MQALPPEYRLGAADREFACDFEDRHHIIRLGRDGDLEFICQGNGSTEQNYRYLFGYRGWPASSIRQAFAELSNGLHYAYLSKQDFVEISRFTKHIGHLATKVALVDEGEMVEPSPAQWLAVEAILDAWGRGSCFWFLHLGEPVTFLRHEGAYDSVQSFVADRLPFPLDSLMPTYEIVRDEEGGVSILGIQPASLRIDEPRPNVIDEMKALRDLPGEAMARIRDFATRDQAWVR